jgi:hypothetical protein
MRSPLDSPPMKIETHNLDRFCKTVDISNRCLIPNHDRTASEITSPLPNVAQAKQPKRDPPESPFSGSALSDISHTSTLAWSRFPTIVTAKIAFATRMLGFQTIEESILRSKHC